MNIGVILSGGVGSRFQAKFPKQYMSLNGKLVIQYVIDTFQESQLFDKILIVINKQYIKQLKNIDNVVFVEEGKTRNESVYNALQACPKNTEYVLFHDAARPFIQARDLDDYFRGLGIFDAMVTSEQITDALYGANRENCFLIQTPEAFHYAKLKKCLDKNSKKIAIVEQLNTKNFGCCKLAHTNLKITTPEDIYTAEQLMKYASITAHTPKLKKKEVLIYGGSGGIGKAITKELLKNGAYVTQYGRKQVDLSQYIPHMPIGRLWDCIIYSAGAYKTDSEGFISSYDEIMNVNFKSLVHLLENAHNMVKTGGNIIILGSTAAMKGREGISLYSASKAAVNAFVEGFYPSLAKHRINVNVICPAKVATKLQTKINPKANPKDMIQPIDLAKVIVKYVDIPSTGNIVYVRVGEC